MIDREKALLLIREHVKNENIVKHMLAAEALMAGIYDYFQKKGKADLGGTREEWLLAGLLHDGDYCDQVPVERQGIQIAEWVKEKGERIPDNVVQCMAAHNPATGTAPQTKMDWALLCGDSLTGLIVAATLVLPSRKLADLTVESVLKRFKEKSFARGTRREDIQQCEVQLGITLRELVKIGLESMKKISDQLGL